MQSPSFTLQEAQTADVPHVLHIDGTSTRVNVFSLTGAVYKADPNELRFYSTHNDRSLVFETVNWTAVDLQLITAALQWYAGLIGNPNMELSIYLPSLD